MTSASVMSLGSTAIRELILCVFGIFITLILKRFGDSQVFPIPMKANETHVVA